MPPPVTIGSSSDLKVGQFAFAIGNPFGLDQSMSSGIVSALKRRLPTHSGREIANVIQTDTAINPGNSGGPLLDSAGRLIGVTTAILSPSGSNAGIGFAVPVDIVNRVVPELIRNGRVPTPGIGIVAASEAVAARLGTEGVIVVRTAPESPAERAGIRGVEFLLRQPWRRHHPGRRQTGSPPLRSHRSDRADRGRQDRAPQLEARRGDARHQCRGRGYQPRPIIPVDDKIIPARCGRRPGRWRNYCSELNELSQAENPLKPRPIR